MPKYAKLPTGSLFPVEDDIDSLLPQLNEERNTSYALVDDGTRIYIRSESLRSSTVQSIVPRHYAHLVRRFIWRIYVLRNMLSNRVDIPDDAAFSMACNLRYTLDVFRFCRPAFRDAARFDTNVRITFFDTFMLEEHYVGRHEPSAVILWQREHPEVNLRTADVSTLGM